MKITLVTDNPNSWIIPYVKKLKGLLLKKHQVVWVKDARQVKKGDLAFFLSCEQIVGKKVLSLNKRNLVVHESALPKGRGWSPVTWQILAGKNKIPITLFEAKAKVDSGDIYLRDYLIFKGDELLDEIKHQQGEKTIDLIVKFVAKYPKIRGRKQAGQSSYYPRRTAQDSELEINKTIKSQFNKLRVVDNERYPAFFFHRGKKYIIKISKES